MKFSLKIYSLKIVTYLPRKIGKIREFLIEIF